MAAAPPIAVSHPRRITGVLLLVGRAALGAILIYAAYAKLHFNGAWHLRDYNFIFAIGIDSYQMLPLWAVSWLALVLPWTELALGLLLIAGIGLRWVASITTALLVVFLQSDVPREVAALVGAALLLTSRKLQSHKMLGLVDWSLLLLFIGLFVVNHALAQTGLTRQAMQDLAAAGMPLSEPAPLFFATLLLANIVSNVPAVMLLLPAATESVITSKNAARQMKRNSPPKASPATRNMRVTTTRPSR